MIRTSMIVVLAMSASAVAHADPANKVTLTGADARDLTLGLKLAGIVPREGAAVVLYGAVHASCTVTDASVTDDGLAITSCQLGSDKPLGAAPSVVLSHAIDAALASKGLVTDSHTSKTTSSVASIYCSIGADVGGKSTDRFSCDVGLRTALDAPVVIKKGTVKGLVHPVP